MWIHKKWVEIKKAANEREMARAQEKRDLEEKRIRAEIELERVAVVPSDPEQAGGGHQSGKPADIRVDLN